MKRRNFLKGLLVAPAVALVGCKALTMPSVVEREPYFNPEDIKAAMVALDDADVPKEGRVMWSHPDGAFIELWNEKLFEEFYKNSYVVTL